MTSPHDARAGALMRTEIGEQPGRWMDLLREREPIDEAADAFTRARPTLLAVAARGSSDHAGLYGQYLAHSLLGVPTMLGTPATLTVYGASLRYGSAVFIALSQSGASPDLIESARAARAGGVPVISATNAPQSPLALAADVHVPLCAGEEFSVAATKTYTAELLALYLLLGRVRGTSWDQLDEAVSALSDAAGALIPELAGMTAPLVTALEHADRALVIGRGYSYATAKEGALKLTETSGIAASGWSAADATHGPLGQVVGGTPVLLLNSSAFGRESITALGEKAAASGAARHVVDVNASPRVADELLPLLEVLVLQHAALETALARGKNPDAPVGLTKVTRTL